MLTSATLDLPTRYRGTKTIATCYNLFDALLPICGVDDLSEGIYRGNPAVPFAQAQRNQHNYLLDQIRCRRDSHLLDIGCGNGTLLQVARARGTQALGLTLSRAQYERCHRHELDVRLLDYRDLPKTWEAAFDGMVANGSLEHFVQPEAAAMGMGDASYQHFFETCYRLLRPHRASRLVTAAIHYGRYVGDPAAMQKNPWLFPWGSDEFHMALLAQVFGGSYPREGQLERCAAGLFSLVTADDGTEDYRLTSEWGLKHVRRCFLHPVIAIKLWARFLPRLRGNFRQGLRLLTLLFSESWQWQFRGKHPPMRHWRHTWERID